MTTREEQLRHIRIAQGAEAETEAVDAEPLRIIVEFDGPRDPESVAADIRRRLDIEVMVARMLDDHGLESDSAEEDGLARFLAVTIPAVSRNTLPGTPFELAYAIADATGALTAEPETGASFFVVPPDGEIGLESIESFPPGCWVPADQDVTEAQPRWAVEAIRAPQAWAMAPPVGGKSRGEGISVFQPDTGVADHVEIEAGMLDLNRAWDFVSVKPGATDPLNYAGNPGHGTGTASVVASRDAGKFPGSAPLATLVPLRAIQSVIVLDHGRVATAVEHARRNGANVITMSLGGAWSSVLRAAMGRAIKDGVIILAAAGNCVNMVVWPARYDEVIAVGGTNIADKAWKGSSHGDMVDISAPGEFVPRANRSPSNGGSPTSVVGGQGTSFAVALTAGVAALWLGYHGVSRVKASLGANETVQGRFVGLLKASARQPPGFDTSEYGAGIVDAARLLSLGLGPAAMEAATEAVAVEDDMRSLRTALRESPIAEPDGVLEATAVPAIAENRRFAAELSHISLQKSLAARAGATTEAPVRALPPSPTLLAAMAAAGGVRR
jgi:hypothetical protein